MLKEYQTMLEYAFDVLNKEYYEGKLPDIVITIMSSPRTNGHFTVNKEWTVEDTKMHEINISAEHLNRSLEEIISTLQHELVHYYCSLNGIADTSQNGRYHNKRFKEEAEKRGLIITKSAIMPSIGYSVTAPTPEFCQLLHKYNICKPLELNRDGVNYFGGIGNGSGISTGISGGEDRTSKKKTSTRKYVCLKCKNSFRATKDINVLCMDCNLQYVKEER